MQENFPTCLSVNDENTGYYEMPSCMFGIIDGTATKSDKSWPWQISISTAKTTCGGTLISLRNCFKNIIESEQCQKLHV
jgi:hypothetical protein